MSELSDQLVDDVYNRKPGSSRALEEHLKPCPECGAPTEFLLSPCQDLGCCGIPNQVFCSECDWDVERFGNLHDLIRDWFLER